MRSVDFCGEFMCGEGTRQTGQLTKSGSKSGHECGLHGWALCPRGFSGRWGASGSALSSALRLILLTVILPDLRSQQLFLKSAHQLFWQKKSPAPSTCCAWSRAYTWRRPTLTRPIVSLPLALQRFTSGFGMGPGGSTALWSPEGDPV